MMYWFGLGLSLVTSALFIVSIRQVEKSRVFLFQAIETSINIVKNNVLGLAFPMELYTVIHQ